MIHDSDASRSSRVISASARPTVRARARWLSGSRSDRIEMNTMLSMPSTISSSSSVANAIHSSGLVSSSTGRRYLTTR
jgi:hypothetical protein